MDGPDLIALVIPVWLLLIVVEIVVTKLRGKNWYRVNDTINSLSLGTIYSTTGTLTKVVGFVTYMAVYELALFDLSESRWWVWVLGFILYDLCYYWNHRMGHEINILWAAHSVHHQSEDYNLSTALRQTSMTFIFSWIFYTPMALMGIPPVVFFVAGAVDLIYQFWIHTRHIPKLGWVERVLVTPSSHRVHHGSNNVYMDKNYGGVFIVWDRMFGTYQEELDNEPVAYGISKPLRSWNPLWANFVVYAQIAKDAFHTRRWRDKLSIWFRKTGWRPEDVTASDPLPVRPDDYQNYNKNPGTWLSAYAGVQFVLNTMFGFYFLSIAEAQSIWFNAIMAAMFIFQLTLIGRLMEDKPYGFLIETVRLYVILVTAYYWHQMNLLTEENGLIVSATTLLSFLVAIFAFWKHTKEHRTDTPLRRTSIQRQQ